MPLGVVFQTWFYTWSSSRAALKVARGNIILERPFYKGNGFVSNLGQNVNLFQLLQMHFPTKRWLRRAGCVSQDAYILHNQKLYQKFWLIISEVIIFSISIRDVIFLWHPFQAFLIHLDNESSEKEGGNG